MYFKLFNILIWLFSLAEQKLILDAFLAYDVSSVHVPGTSVHADGAQWSCAYVFACHFSTPSS